MSVTKPGRRRTRSVGRPAENKVGERSLVIATIELLKTTHPARLNRLEIARAANVDPALIRYYFGDMERLLAQTAFEITEEIIASMNRRKAEYAQMSPRAALEDFVRGFFESVTRFPNYHQMILQQIFYGGSKQARAMRKRLQVAGQESLRDVIGRGVAAGEFRDVDTRFLEVALIGLSEAMVTGWALVEDLFPPTAGRANTTEAYETFICSMILAHVGRGAPTAGKPARVKKAPAR
jgi:TetR/AcrR family transcriptional regulator